MKSIGRLFVYCLAMLSYKKRISDLLGIDLAEVERFYREIDDSEFMKIIISSAGIKKGYFDFSMASILRAPTLYVLCRIMRPEIVVETGVANGFSSAFILYALEKNGKGKLYSIDLPNQQGQEIRGGRRPGWLVPEELIARWELILGDSKKELPVLCERLKNIDIFYHDSDHSYASMTFEFTNVFENVCSKGLIVSDDITDNRAFSDFCKKMACRNTELFKLGILQKDSV
jgi:hypothetical protein